MKKNNNNKSPVGFKEPGPLLLRQQVINGPLEPLERLCTKSTVEILK